MFNEFSASTTPFAAVLWPSPKDAEIIETNRLSGRLSLMLSFKFLICFNSNSPNLISIN